jgi:hypothetical protein
VIFFCSVVWLSPFLQREARDSLSVNQTEAKCSLSLKKPFPLNVVEKMTKEIKIE